MTPLADDLVELIAERFRLLGEPTRIKLLDRLREREATVFELTELIGTTQQNVSKHLGLLQRAGVVGRRQQGNFAYYRIVDEGVHALCEAVCGSLQARVDELRRVVGESPDVGTPPPVRAETMTPLLLRTDGNHSADRA